MQHLLWKECQVAESGKDAKISMWFNGSSLVQMETKGSGLNEAQATLWKMGKGRIEITPIEPPGKLKRSTWTRAPDDDRLILSPSNLEPDVIFIFANLSPTCL